MIKKMRRRFVAAAMFSFSAVIILLVVAVNIWNVNITADRQDKTIESIIRNEARENRNEKDIADGAPPFDGDFNVSGPFGYRSRDFGFTVRYFSVHFDSDGNTLVINTRHIASVEKDEAEEYARKILRGKKEKGFYKSFRYSVIKPENETIIIFLNSERETQTIKTIMLVSVIIAFFSISAVFILVLIFSKRAISPYVKNIEAQKRFITDAGHELKTPLTSISASADILLMDFEDNEWIINIKKQCERMSKLTVDLITLSKLDEESEISEPESFSLSKSITEISDTFSTLAEAKNKKYSSKIVDGIVFSGNKNELEKMVYILLDNALKYSDDGGKIELNVQKNGKKTEISVGNSCENVNALDTEHIFDRFYKADRSRSDSDSFGIGLSIAKSIAEKHHGDISVSISKNNYIKFTVLL